MANLESFKDRVIYYCGSVPNRRGVRAAQGDLAEEIIMDPADFSKRLNGKKSFSCHDIKRIIEVLAEWEAITTQEQAVELLDLAGCEHFSQAQWNAKPRSELAHFVDKSTYTVHTKHVPLTGEQKDMQEKALPGGVASFEPVPILELSSPEERNRNGFLRFVSSQYERELGYIFGKNTRINLNLHKRFDLTIVPIQSVFQHIDHVSTLFPLIQQLGKCMMSLAGECFSSGNLEQEKLHYCSN